MSRQPGVTIILVGGFFTTEDGVTMDSRQPMEGEPIRRLVTPLAGLPRVRTLGRRLRAAFRLMGFAARSSTPPKHPFGTFGQLS